ncbi:membrane hypothetical protein [Candidatus Nitrotoga sp. HW29]|uniref:hypothetical protein n=1 Tax=Candidatus Nitrotoga sp. HW29 TaxID=2886963 RepID=UPI001EF19FB3|nr:hypothetical protein [Candidatus Nitrotoga sp. HW29]CAH1903972.1 membrane hypothetical protein [Candidatus Nitrotoga sp. HW29]
MGFAFQLAMPYKYLTYYIIGMSMLRGLAVPDFRYGYFSVAVIQVVYSILLLLPLLIGKGVHPGYWGYLLLGLAGIVLSQIVAVSRYTLESGVDAVLDSVTGAIFIWSLAAMIVLFAVILKLFVYWKN